MGDTTEKASENKPTNESSDIWIHKEPTRAMVLATIRLMLKPEVSPQERRERMQEWYPAILGRFCWKNTEFNAMSGIDREAASLSNFIYQRIQRLGIRGGKVMIPADSEQCPDECDRESCVRRRKGQFSECRHAYSCKEDRACSWRCALRRALLDTRQGLTTPMDIRAVLVTKVMQGDALKHAKLQDVKAGGQ